MQKVIVQIDWYTKIILTLIAIFLVGLLVKSYFPPHTPEAEAGDTSKYELMKRLENLGFSFPPPKIELSKGERIEREAKMEGRYVKDWVDYLYLYNLQNLSRERALEIIDESSILSGYPAGKGYAKLLVVSGRNEAYREYLSDKAMETVLLSGRFEVTPYGIVPRPLRVEAVK